MRHIILYFLLLSTVVANGQTTIYHPFPESNAVWNVNYYFYCLGGPGGGSFTTYDYPIIISGDTIIQNQLYRKFETPFYDGSSTDSCSGVPNGPRYQGAFRQEITNKKVFFIPPSQNTEQLLFDFNMEVGDTVKGYLATHNPNHSITSIDSVQVDNNYRKRWNVGANSNIGLIEGVGSTFGFFQPLLGVLSHEPFYELTCFQENGATLYPELTTECLVVTDIQSISPQKPTPVVFPNPSTGAVQLNFSTSVNSLTLNIFSSLGELVSSKHLNDLSSYRLNLPDVRGVYLIQLIDRSGDENVLRVVKE